MGKLFGTDGIRGRANHYPLTAETALKTGRAVASLFCNSTKNTVLISKDTRISGDIFEAALTAGICSMGYDAEITGVLPTPGAAFCVRNSDKIAAGVVISASHNPYYDNGIKIFNQSGFKLEDEEEEKLEELILMDDQYELYKNIEHTGKVKKAENASDLYREFLEKVVENKFKKLKIVIDCSNGATSKIAKDLFENIGMECEVICFEPDGININDNCGSEHPEKLSGRVLDSKADIGLAFDGDGDRLIVVDEKGKILTGDQVIAICAAHAKDKGLLDNSCAVTTIMSNLGLKAAFEDLGIKHFTAGVGDRKVMEEMKKTGAVIGGEDSGHMIFLKHHTTGDGMLSAVKLLEVMNETGKSVSELSLIMKVFPQKLINVDVKSKPEIKTVKEITEIINQVESELADKGRVLVRYSGTQPVCRVMVEGPDEAATEIYCDKIAKLVEKVLN